MVAAVLSFAMAPPASAQLECAPGDWPGWRGPDRTGVSTETGLLPSWPEGGPPLAWKVTGLGRGWSTPSVAAGRIYLMGATDGQEFAIALNADGGKEVWRTRVGKEAEGRNNYPGPRCTPTVDGERIYVLGSDGDLFCLDLAGQVVWRKNMDKDFEGRRGIWAYSESPLVDGERLIVSPGGAKNSLVALAKATGNLIWSATVPEGGEAAYSSAIAADAGPTRQYVQFLRNGVAGVASADGKFLWMFGKGATRTNCSTPIARANFIFESDAGPGGGGCGLLKMVANGDGIKAEEVYFNKNLANHHGGVVLVGDSLYGTTQTSLVCMDFLSGSVKWSDRSVGKGSVTAADGRLYVRAEKSGDVALVEATPAGYKEVGRFVQPDRGARQCWCHPVIANGRLYLRDDDLLLCYEVKAK
jgi:outer membrane protein assembly factor BamB